MSKKFYCSSCGVELTYSRKAIPGKGHILDLIDPHECEGFAIKSDRFGKPTVLDVLAELKPLGATTLVGSEDKSKKENTGFFRNLKDERAISSAPEGIRRSLALSEDVDVTEDI